MWSVLLRVFLDRIVQEVELSRGNEFWGRNLILCPRSRGRKFPLNLCEKDVKRICAKVRAALLAWCSG